MPRPYIWPLMLPPCCGAEEQQHGEQLQPPEEHVERQHDLRQGGEVRIAAERADLEAQARADVVQRGEHGCHARLGPEVIERDQQDGHDGNGGVADEERHGAADDLAAHAFAVHRHDLHGVGVQQVARLGAGRLGQNEHAADLHAAARRPGARADGH